MRRIARSAGCTGVRLPAGFLVLRKLGDGGGQGVWSGGVLALEEHGGDLGEFVGAIFEPGAAAFVITSEVVHDGHGVLLAGPGESNGIGDPDAIGAGVLFPAVFVAGMVLRAGAPDSPVLVDGADVLEPADEVPSFVVTHRTREDLLGGNGGTFAFDGLAAAARRARDAAGGKDVLVLGAHVAGQLLRAGLLDEVRIHLVPLRGRARRCSPGSGAS
jgi:hypothetical protein